ncbi:MAG: hypothetical protein ACE5GC_10960, partial [Acidimicrobiia bacterium]
MSSLPEGPSPVVVAAVLGTEPAAVARTLTAVRRQVYGPDRVVVAGRGDGVRALADQAAIDVVASARDVVAGLSRPETHVWFLRAGAEPRPGALRALVTEAARVGA